MVTLERIDERGDELQELRERYNQLCAALAFGSGSAAASGDRLLQELQNLAQRIVAMEARQANAAGSLHESEARGAAASPSPSETASHAATPPSAAARPSNVIAFRFKMKAAGDQQPGFIPDMTSRKPLPQDRAETDRCPARPETPPAIKADEVRSAIIAQGEAILLISGRCDDHRARLTRIEDQLAASTDLPQLSAEVAALRDGSEKQRQQLVVLATAVHRLARLLADDSDSNANI
jgi:uncharacterized coiled-coil protein SlyX